MEFFDNVANKTKELFEVGEKKASEIVSIQKLRLEVAHLESKMGNTLKRLGTEIYKQRENEAFAEFADIFTELDATAAGIAEKNAEISRIKGLKKCDKCGMFNDEGAAYCSKCGRQF